MSENFEDSMSPKAHDRLTLLRSDAFSNVVIHYLWYVCATYKPPRHSPHPFSAVLCDLSISV